MDNTIELWEQEIANQPGIFETLTKQIDFLSESVELDCKLLEMGIITEGDEEESEGEESNDSNENTGSDKKFLSNIKEKFLTVYEKIRYGLRLLKERIKKVIVEKLDQFAKNNIIKKFASTKIDTKKMAEKLNKTILFNPKTVYDDFYNMDFQAVDNIDIKYYEDYLKKHKDIMEFLKYALRSQQFDTGKTYIESGYRVKIDPNNAKNEITKLYETTQECVKKLENIVNNDEKIVNAQITKVKNIKDKEELKLQKKILNMLKNKYKANQNITNIFVKQAINLQAIMIGFANHNNGGENQEETNNNEEENK